MKRWSLYNPFSLDLYAHPEISTHKDGSLIIELQAITPEYIDGQIKIIETIGTLNLDEVIRIVRESKNFSEAKTMLVSKFNISGNVADFLLDMEFGEMDKYLNDAKFRKLEIAKWNALREVIS